MCLESSEKYDNRTILVEAVNLVQEALIKMNSVNHDGRSRELSTAITQIEGGLMWLNKDRAVKGYLPPSPTHFQSRGGSDGVAGGGGASR